MSEIRNTIRTKAAVPKQKPAAKQKSAKSYSEKKKSNPSKFGKMVQSFLGGTFLEKETFLKNLPFILFMSLIALIYIANTYLAEKTIRDIEKTKTSLKELRSEYITSKSELLKGKKQSLIAGRLKMSSEKLKVDGLKESLDSPLKIVKTVRKDTSNEKNVKE